MDGHNVEKTTDTILKDTAILLENASFVRDNCGHIRYNIREDEQHRSEELKDLIKLSSKENLSLYNQLWEHRRFMQASIEQLNRSRTRLLDKRGYMDTTRSLAEKGIEIDTALLKDELSDELSNKPREQLRKLLEQACGRSAELTTLISECDELYLKQACNRQRLDDLCLKVDKIINCQAGIRLSMKPDEHTAAVTRDETTPANSGNEMCVAKALSETMELKRLQERLTIKIQKYCDQSTSMTEQVVNDSCNEIMARHVAAKYRRMSLNLALQDLDAQILKTEKLRDQLSKELVNQAGIPDEMDARVEQLESQINDMCIRETTSAATDINAFKHASVRAIKNADSLSGAHMDISDVHATLLDQRLALSTKISLLADQMAADDSLLQLISGLAM